MEAPSWTNFTHPTSTSHSSPRPQRFSIIQHQIQFEMGLYEPITSISWYCILLSIFAFFVCQAIYNLKFHPLAGFPGPFIAAVTSFYTGYYELHPSYSLAKTLPKLHDRYGTWLHKDIPRLLTDADLAQAQLFGFRPTILILGIWMRTISELLGTSGVVFT